VSGEVLLREGLRAAADAALRDAARQGQTGPSGADKVQRYYGH
jgi:hypothetical protein